MKVMHETTIEGRRVRFVTDDRVIFIEEYKGTDRLGAPRWEDASGELERQANQYLNKATLGHLQNSIILNIPVGPRYHAKGALSAEETFKTMLKTIVNAYYSAVTPPRVRNIQNLQIVEALALALLSGQAQIIPGAQGSWTVSCAP